MDWGRTWQSELDCHGSNTSAYSKECHEPECGVTADPSRAGGRTPSPASSRMPVETPSQRDPAAAHEERGVVIFAGSVSMKFKEQ